MRNDLIKRSDAIEALGEEPYVWTDDDEFAQGERSQWIDDVSAIRAVPSANKPQGEWIMREDWDGDNYYDCSVCGESFVLIDGTPSMNLYHYCPNCGAKMKGTDDEKSMQGM